MVGEAMKREEELETSLCPHFWAYSFPQHYVLMAPVFLWEGPTNSEL
jgi:hypothetical protein